MHAVGEQIRDTQRELAALGPKPRRPVVRAALSALAGRIHAAEAAAGEWYIETEEREDLSRIFEDLTHAAKLPALAAEITEWLIPGDG